MSFCRDSIKHKEDDRRYKTFYRENDKKVNKYDSPNSSAMFSSFIGKTEVVEPWSGRLASEMTPNVSQIYPI